MIITDLEPQKNKLRVNVHIDGRFAFGISQELRFEKKLEVGNPITQAEIDSLIELDQITRLTVKVLNFLSFRPRAEKEIYDHFLLKSKMKNELSEEEQKKFRESLSRVVEKIKSYGQINDLEFVKWWVDQRDRFKPRGQRLLRAELKQKGVDDETINRFFSQNQITPEQNLETALSIIQKKLFSWQKLPYQEFRKKVSDFLMRKGYSWETIKAVLESVKKPI